MADPFRLVAPGEKVRGNLRADSWNAMLEAAAAFRRGKLGTARPAEPARTAGFAAVVVRRHDTLTADDEEITADSETATADGAAPELGHYPWYEIRRVQTVRRGDAYEGLDPEPATLRAFALGDRILGEGAHVWARLRGPGEIGSANTPTPVYEITADPGYVFPGTVTGSYDYGDGIPNYSWQADDGSGRECPAGQWNATAWYASDEVGGEPIPADTKVLLFQVEGDPVAFKLYRASPVLATTNLTFSGARVTATVSVTDGPIEALPFDTEDFDTDDYHSNSVNNTRLTAPTTGFYAVGGGGLWAATLTAPISVRMRVGKNGFAGIVSEASDYHYYDGVFLPEQSLSVSGIVYLDAGDYVELFGWHNRVSGGPRSVQAWFWMHRLGV